MRLDSDDFAVFGLERAFRLDPQRLDAQRRALLSEVHPDRFAGGDAGAQRQATQWAVRVNEAYARLKDPLQRASYLCELGGAPIRAEENSAMPADFLTRQMTWRESLDDATTRADVEAIAEQLDVERRAAFERLERTLDAERDHAAAASQVRALMFVERFAGDVDARLEAVGA